MDTELLADWPGHKHEMRAWSQTARAGTREDRTLREIQVSLPPNIAELEFTIPPGAQAESERTSYQIAYTEGAAGDQLKALGHS